MKYTSLDLTVMMEEATARRADLTAKLSDMESRVNEYYNMAARYEKEPNEAEAEKLWTAMADWTKRENHLREALDSNHKLFDLLEAAQAELTLIEALEREGL